MEVAQTKPGMEHGSMLSLVTTAWDSPRLTRVVQRLIDLFLLAGAHLLAFVLRFEGSLDRQELQSFAYSVVGVVLVQYLCLIAARVPESSWRYVSLREVRRISVAMASATVILATLLTLLDFLPPPPDAVQNALPPRGVIFLDLVLGLLGLISIRAATRTWVERACSRQYSGGAAPSVPTLLIGAGSAGAAAAKQILQESNLGIELRGFLDDDASKLGMVIQGVEVLGTVADVEQIAKETGVQQAIITIGHPSGDSVRRILDQCKKSGIPAKVIPAIRYILQEKVNLAEIRDVAIEDLLQREPVQLDVDTIAGFVNGRCIMITGAGGSIGSELCRIVSRFGPANLLLVDNTENNLFQIHRELIAREDHPPLVPCLVDICDRPQMQRIFETHRPDMVLHAAAYKHVPMIEWNPGAAVKNNVLGTKIVSDLAHECRVREFVMISTDKAVNPTSIMGACKRVAEIYIQALARRSKTRFVAVRFGNVLGSAGSVIPTFREQIARGGPVTVTHPDMKRYFMTIPEACQLVLQAATMGHGGEIFILDMGEPVKIVDLARNLIALSGFAPGQIPIVFTGMRPGEKLFEELALKDEIATKTRHSKIFIGKLQPVAWEHINHAVLDLQPHAEGADLATIVRKLKSIVPEFDANLLPAPHNPALTGNGAASPTNDKAKSSVSGARSRKKSGVFLSGPQRMPDSDLSPGGLPTLEVDDPGVTGTF